MRPGTVLGALLVLAGVIALSVGGLSFGSHGMVPVRTVLGCLALLAGLILIIASSRKAG